MTVMRMFTTTSTTAVAVFVCCLISDATALQGNNYLSQLAGPSTTSTSTNGNNFFPVPSTTVGQGHGHGMNTNYNNNNNGNVPTAAFGLSSGPTTATASTTVASGITPSQILLDLWSAQVSVELSASQLYLSASIWCRTHGFKGMAAWMLEESGEERGHGLAILEWSLQQQGWPPVELRPLEAPRNDWTSPTQVWQSILEAEQTNTQNLLRLAAAAAKSGDYGSQAFLNPFHVEQIEAEDKVSALLHKVANASPEFLIQLDHELGLEAEEEAGHGGH